MQTSKSISSVKSVLNRNGSKCARHFASKRRPCIQSLGTSEKTKTQEYISKPPGWKEAFVLQVLGSNDRLP